MSERVFVLGAGRAGRGLARAFREGGVEVVGLHGRHRGEAGEQITIGALPPSLASATTVLVTVRDAQLDAALAELAAGALRAEAVILHASGSADPVGLSALRSAGHAAGTFHPLVPLADPSHAPALVRGSYIGLDGDAAARARGRALAAALGAHTLDIPAGRKPLYHAAAVLVSNFSPVLLALGEHAMTDAGIPADLARRALLPLWSAAAENARALPASQAITGPAARGDTATIRANLTALAGDPLAREVYRVMTEAVERETRERGTGKP
ncbi:MAG TPA: DUF2520 domain-containing protein [Gemmatimonadaceae bacterium]|nr:DUF2520 domain-containing protein [Gemmatimonadaceae bacterium]